MIVNHFQNRDSRDLARVDSSVPVPWDGTVSGAEYEAIRMHEVSGKLFVPVPNQLVHTRPGFAQPLCQRSGGPQPVNTLRDC